VLCCFLLDVKFGEISQQQTVCAVTHHITTSPYLSNKLCVLWRTTLPLHISATNCVCCDAPHYHFSISKQQTVCTVTHHITTSYLSIKLCVLWRTTLPLLHI